MSASTTQPVTRTATVREPLQELHLRGIVLPAVRDVDRGDDQIAELYLHDAGFDVERRMPEYRIAGDELPANLQRHARIALTAVPARVILGELAFVRDLRRLGLQFLETHHVRSLALEPLSDLGGTRPDAVHIPGGDFHAVDYRDPYTALPGRVP